MGKGPRWMSADKRLGSRNLRASPYATKQSRKGDMRAWWFIVLARGEVGVVFVPKGWRQTGVGIAQFVDQLEDKLRKAPTTVINHSRGPLRMMRCRERAQAALKSPVPAWARMAGDDLFWHQDLDMGRKFTTRS